MLFPDRDLSDYLLSIFVAINGILIALEKTSNTFVIGWLRFDFNTFGDL